MPVRAWVVPVRTSPGVRLLGSDVGDLPRFCRVAKHARQERAYFGPQRSVPKPDTSCCAYSGRRCDGPCRPKCAPLVAGHVTLASDLWEVAPGLAPPLLGPTS